MAYYKILVRIVQAGSLFLRHQQRILSSRIFLRIQLDYLMSIFLQAVLLLEYSRYHNVVYTRLQKLGTKIIFSASILDSGNSFDSKATAMRIEDMQKVLMTGIRNLF